MIKLIVSDIDGTLVEDGENTLKEEMYREILRLRAKGIQFAAASGRQWISIERIFEPVKEKIFYISDNGAYVGIHGRRLFTTPIDRRIILSMIHDVRKIPGLELMISAADMIYLETGDEQFVRWLVDSYKFAVRRVDDLTKVDGELIKISVYCRQNVEAAARAIWEKYKDQLKIAIAGDMWMDCMAKAVNKGAAIREIQQSLGISSRETMAFGDQLNDLEMLKRAYYSFAIGNARPEVKAAARFQADTNVNDGVLKILKLL